MTTRCTFILVHITHAVLHLHEAIGFSFYLAIGKSPCWCSNGTRCQERFTKKLRFTITSGNSWATLCTLFYYQTKQKKIIHEKPLFLPKTNLFSGLKFQDFFETLKNNSIIRKITSCFVLNSNNVVSYNNNKWRLFTFL